MLGFLFGTACLIGLIKVVKGGHWGHGGGYGRSWMMRRLFQRLDTTPGQEKVILSATEEVERSVRRVKEELRASRAEVAKAFRGDNLDGAAVREVFAKQDVALEAVRKAITDGLQSVHEALTPEQRKGLADLVEFGPGRGCHGGGFSRGCGGGRFAGSRGTPDAVQL